LIFVLLVLCLLIFMLFVHCLLIFVLSVLLWLTGT